MYEKGEEGRKLLHLTSSSEGFPDSSVGKESACNAGDPGSIAGSGRSAGEGTGYPLQYSCLENSMDCIVHGVAKSRTRLSDFHFREDGRVQVCDALHSTHHMAALQAR